jgi:hypothetical protein
MLFLSPLLLGRFVTQIQTYTFDLDEEQVTFFTPISAQMIKGFKNPSLPVLLPDVIH